VLKSDLTGYLNSKIESSKLLLLSRLGILAAITSASLGISMLTGWILSSYYRVDLAGSLMYKANDGWCRPDIEGIGVHCFGDFNERLNPSKYDQWEVYPNNLELTPVGPFITSLANLVSGVTSPKIVLVVFYIMAILFLAYPIFNATKGMSSVIRIFVLSTFCFSTYPVLVLLDRLNYLLFSVPILYFVYKKCIENSDKNLTFVLVLLAIIKPQFAILSLLYLIRGDVRKFVRVFFLQVSSVLSLIVLAGLGDFGRIKEYVRIVGGYGAFIWDLNTQNPPNAALSKGLYLIYQAIFKLITGGKYRANDVDNLIFTILAGCIVIFVMLLLYLNRSIFSNIELVFSLTILGILGLGNYVATYYLIFILPFMAAHICKMRDSNSEKEKVDNSRPLLDRCFKEFALAYTFTITTVIVPKFTFGISLIPNSNTIEIISPSLATLFWFWYIIRLATSRKQAGKYAI
jgi:hypothetical protein